MTPLERSQIENIERAIDWTVKGMKRVEWCMPHHRPKDADGICDLCQAEPQGDWPED